MSAIIYPKSTQNVFKGNFSLYILPDAGGYLDLELPGGNSFGTFGYRSMEMEVSPGYSERFCPRIDIELEGRDKFVNVDLTGLEYTFREDSWTHVTVLLGKANAANRHLDCIRLTGTIDGPYYIDDLKLVPFNAITIFAMMLLIPALSKKRRRLSGKIRSLQKSSAMNI